MSLYPSSGEFDEQVGTSFNVLTNGGTLELRLIEVSTRTCSPNIEQFSLEFEGSADRPLTQGTYRLEHAILGNLDLFLVPVGRTDQDCLYEAAFSLLPEGSIREVSE